MSPAQSTIAEVAADATGATRNDKARQRALLQAKADAKSAFDNLRVATEKGCDGSVRDDLVKSATTRLELALAALRSLA